MKQKNLRTTAGSLFNRKDRRDKIKTDDKEYIV